MVQRGQILMVTVVLIALMSVTGLATAFISRKQVETVSDILESAVAIAAADAGAEQALYDFWRNPTAPPICSSCLSGTLSNGAVYTTSYDFNSPRSITSSASFHNVRRAFRLSNF